MIQGARAVLVAGAIGAIAACATPEPEGCPAVATIPLTRSEVIDDDASRVFVGSSFDTREEVTVGACLSADRQYRYDSGAFGFEVELCIEVRRPELGEDSVYRLGAADRLLVVLVSHTGKVVFPFDSYFSREPAARCVPELGAQAIYRFAPEISRQELAQIGVALNGVVTLLPIPARGAPPIAKEDPFCATRRALRRVSNLLGRGEPPRADGSGEDPTGLALLADGLMAQKTWGSHQIVFSGVRGRYETNHAAGRTWLMESGSIEEVDSDDGWGRPIRYRSPGPVHRHGWDLYSVGPNGLDELGDGDDILIGEDLPRR